MTYTVTILAVMFSAVLFGIFNRRWSMVCALFVLHIAIAGFIIGCVTHWVPLRQHMASPFGSNTPAKQYWETLPGKS